jgi:hypothetical protein
MMNTLYHFLKQSGPVAKEVEKLHFGHRYRLAADKIGMKMCKDVKTAGKCRVS